MSTRKNRDAVDEAAEGAVVSEGAVLADPVVEPTLDPDLDLVPVEEDLEPADANGSDTGTPDTATTEVGSGRKSKLAVGAVVALVVAAGAVWAAGALGSSSEPGLPESVSDPAVVIGALQDGGISCTGGAVTGEVATCNSTIAVRIFESPDAAEKWVAVLLKDPHTNSAIGWVRHGNVVVAGPLNAAPDISAALGAGAQIY